MGKVTQIKVRKNKPLKDNSMNIEHKIIPDEDGKGFTYAFIGSDVEYVDPIKYYGDRTIQTRTIIYKKMLALKSPDFPIPIVEKVANRNATDEWEEQLNKILATKVPDNLFKLLKCDSKKEQVRLLKGLQLTPEILISFFFVAYKAYGFKFSQYKSEHFPKAIDKSDLPKLAILERTTGEVKKVGNTSLTDGQIKQAIEQRKVIVAKFLDDGSNWHAFFITFKSIGGEESWKNGQPHYHYISDKFGISREEAVKQFKSDKYPTTSVHIELLDYGTQPEK